jgi:hypothetical protein
MFLLSAIAVAGLSCRKTATAVDSAAMDYRRPGALFAAYASLDDLGQAVVKALNDSSAAGLWALSVTETEFRDIVFPRTPNSAGMPWDYIWQMNLMDDISAVYSRLEEYGGQNLTFLRTHLADTAVVVYPGKRTYHDVILVVATPEGAQKEIKFLSTVAEIDGRFKAVVFDD